MLVKTETTNQKIIKHTKEEFGKIKNINAFKPTTEKQLDFKFFKCAEINLFHYTPMSLNLKNRTALKYHIQEVKNGYYIIFSKAKGTCAIDPKIAKVPQNKRNTWIQCNQVCKLKDGLQALIDVYKSKYKFGRDLRPYFTYLFPGNYKKRPLSCIYLSSGKPDDDVISKMEKSESSEFIRQASIEFNTIFKDFYSN